MSSRFIRLKEVIERTGLPRSTIYQLIKSGDFPASIRLSKRTVAWVEGEVDEWIVTKIEATRVNDHE